MAKKMKKKGFADGGLTGKQTKLDKNKDGKISGEDFKKMKGGGMAKKGYAGGGKVKKKGFNVGGMPMAGGMPAKPAPGGMPATPTGGAGGGRKAKMAELQKRAAAGDQQAKAELAKMKRDVGPRAELSPPTPAKPMMPMKKGGMAKKGYAKGGVAKKGFANGGVSKKKAKKATKSKAKVRGAGIAKKGVRKCKMR